MMDYFILVINKDEHITSSEFALNYDGARSDCGMKVDLYSLCGKLTRAASDYYHSNKELFEFFQYQLIQYYSLTQERQIFMATFAVFLLLQICEISKTVFQNSSADSY